MRLMIFYDLENFKKSLEEINKDVYEPQNKYRLFKYTNFKHFLTNFIKDKLKLIDCSRSTLIRNYIYTGLYTKDIIEKIEKEIEELEGEEKAKKEKFLEHVKNKREKQKRELEYMRKYCSFLEVKTLPLQYEDGKIFQKGIDVQLAVDLVSHAFKNNFDIGVVCSGDIDLMHSLKICKDLGKKIIVSSHPQMMSKQLNYEADYFINLARIGEEDLDLFSTLKEKES